MASAEEEELEKTKEIKAFIRRHVSLDPGNCPEDQEWEMGNAADAIWRHVIVPMCRT